jgi:hypothetical protein
MEVQLVKREDRYDLYLLHGHKIASTLNGAGSKLSLKNCEAIERGYDLDELAEKEYPIFNLSVNATTSLHILHQESFKIGFQKALELMGDKKFSEEDVKKIIHWSTLDEDVRLSEEELFQSLQQTEWDVEIEMEEPHNYKMCSNPKDHMSCLIPKLDADGCLILKRI